MSYRLKIRQAADRHEVRRVLTKRFPYRIVFSLKGEVVVVHAVLHGRRDDRHWKDPAEIARKEC